MNEANEKKKTAYKIHSSYNNNNGIAMISEQNVCFDMENDETKNWQKSSARRVFFFGQNLRREIKTRK